MELDIEGDCFENLNLKTARKVLTQISYFKTFYQVYFINSYFKSQVIKKCQQNDSAMNKGFVLFHYLQSNSFCKLESAPDVFQSSYGARHLIILTNSKCKKA